MKLECNGLNNADALVGHAVKDILNNKIITTLGNSKRFTIKAQAPAYGYAELMMYQDRVTFEVTVKGTEREKKVFKYPISNAKQAIIVKSVLSAIKQIRKLEEMAVK